MADTELLTLDTKEVATAALLLGATVDQVGYAMSVALNEAAKDARQFLIESTWPTKMHVRSAGLMRASLSTIWSTRSTLTVTVYDKLQAAHLELHARGGDVNAKGGQLAIPNLPLQQRKTSRGIPSELHPKALVNSFRKGNVIYQRQPKSSMGKRWRSRMAKIGPRTARRMAMLPPVERACVKLMYVLKPSVHLRARVPLYEDFYAVMKESIMNHLPDAVAKAMETRYSKKV